MQDDGSIDWAYNYQVNNDTYQYSCMSELNDGTVALLYENGSASEKFEKYSIERIAYGAKIAHAHVATSEGTQLQQPFQQKMLVILLDFQSVRRRQKQQLLKDIIVQLLMI